jgi:hypothetical protein
MSNKAPKPQQPLKVMLLKDATHRHEGVTQSLRDAERKLMRLKRMSGKPT